MLIVIASFFRKTFIHQRHIDIYLLGPNYNVQGFNFLHNVSTFLRQRKKAMLSFTLMKTKFSPQHSFL